MPMLVMQFCHYIFEVASFVLFHDGYFLENEKTKLRFSVTPNLFFPSVSAVLLWDGNTSVAWQPELLSTYCTLILASLRSPASDIMCQFVVCVNDHQLWELWASGFVFGHECLFMVRGSLTVRHVSPAGISRVRLGSCSWPPRTLNTW